MRIKKLGNIVINPKNLLIDGLGKELYLKLKAIIDTENDNILLTLMTQAKKLRTLQQAFYFVCQFIEINGVIIWQDKLNDIVNIGIQDAYINCLQIKVTLITFNLNFILLRI